MTEADDITGTGDARVDEAVDRLGELEDAPLDEHPVILGEIHDRLREVLGELAPTRPARPTPRRRRICRTTRLARHTMTARHDDGADGPQEPPRPVGR